MSRKEVLYSGIIIKETGTLAKIIPHTHTHTHKVPGPAGFIGEVKLSRTNDLKLIQVTPDHRKREITFQALSQWLTLEDNGQ